LGGVCADDVVQVFEPLVHVSGFIATFATLLAGDTVALYDGFDVDRYALAAVVGVADAEEGQVPVAFVVARPGASLSADELLAFAAEHIAAYKLPARVHLRPSLPLTASGKISRRYLHE
jgi:AMP-binding enzyme C-terminal domain